MRAGIDIGGTKTQAVVVDDRDRVLAECTVPSRGGPVATVAGAAEAVRGAVARAGGQRSDDGAPARVTRVGVGIPGQVDTHLGVVARAVNLGIDSLPLADALADELGVPVAVDNDVKATALGAFRLLGGDRGTSPSVLTYVNLGSGVAAATVVGGRLLRGVDNLAGEIGHVVIEPDGELCGCGQHGCLETVAGGLYLDRRLRSTAGVRSVAELYEPAVDGRLGSTLERDRLTAAVAWALTLVTTSYGPTHVVLGGGVLRHAPGLLESVCRRLRNDAAGSPYLAALDVAARVVVLPADTPAGALGAAFLTAAPAVEDLGSVPVPGVRLPTP